MHSRVDDIAPAERAALLQRLAAEAGVNRRTVRGSLLAGFAIVALGVPVYFMWGRRSPKA
mgnify:CR=1 FL=1